MSRGRAPDKALLWMIRAGLALILLTPFVVTPQTVFPFVVGKALYSRTIIEIVFVAWVLLVLFQPAYRPPRSRLLILLGVALGVAVLSASLGVSVQRSFWSNYERMQGVVDQAHWFVLAVVLASVARTDRSWRTLLILNVAAGTLIGLLTVVQYHGQLQAYGPEAPRVMATLGNPIFLAACFQVNVTIALGFLVRSFVPADPADPGVPADPGKAAAPAATHGRGRPRRGTRRGKRTSPPGAGGGSAVPPPPRGKHRAEPSRRRLPMARAVGRGSPPARWLGRGAWTAAALIGVWALSLTASRGPVLGLVAGLGFLAVVYSFLARTRTARLVAIGCGSLTGVAVVFLFVTFISPGASSLLESSVSNLLVERLADFDGTRTSLRNRVWAWQTAARGFLDHPVLGWGPENYIAVLGRHGGELVAEARVHDHAHSKLLEELAAKGLLGLSSYLAVWAFAFHVLVRAAGNMGSRERVPVLFAGAALMGYFVQSLASPESAVGALHSTLLLALAARLESVGEERSAAASRGDGLLPALAGTMGRFIAERRGIRSLLIAGTTALAGAGLIVSYATWSAANALNHAIIGAGHPAVPAGRVRLDFERAISHFEPLANFPRRVFFQFAGEHWRKLRTRRPGEAGRMLAMVNAEAAAAVASEPENWQIHAALARLYGLVSLTDPEYRYAAERHLERARALVPYKGEELSATFGLDVYVDQGKLVYVKRPCTPAWADAKFLLHVIPVRQDDLPDHRRHHDHDFDNLDFHFDRHGGVVRDGKCRVAVDLPRYAIVRIFTGQYAGDGGTGTSEVIWREEVPLR